MVTHRRLELDPNVRARLVRAVGRVRGRRQPAHPQRRHRRRRARRRRLRLRPALDARRRPGRRRVSPASGACAASPIDELIVGHYDTTLEEDELITRVVVPRPTGPADLPQAPDPVPGGPSRGRGRRRTSRRHRSCRRRRRLRPASALRRHLRHVASRRRDERPRDRRSLRRADQLHRRQPRLRGLPTTRGRGPGPSRPHGGGRMNGDVDRRASTRASGPTPRPRGPRLVAPAARALHRAGRQGHQHRHLVRRRRRRRHHPGGRGRATAATAARSRTSTSSPRSPSSSATRSSPWWRQPRPPPARRPR